MRFPPCRSGSSARRRACSPPPGISGLLARLAAGRPDTAATCVTAARAPAVSFSSIPGVHSMHPPFIAKKPQGRRDRPQRLNPPSLALLAALACVPGVSGAQDARPGPPSAGATAAPAGGGAPEPAGVTVTARRAEGRAQDVPFGSGVMDGEEIGARRQPTLEEALRGTPGVNVWSDGSPHSANVLIRGTGSINPVSTDDGAV